MFAAAGKAAAATRLSIPPSLINGPFLVKYSFFQESLAGFPKIRLHYCHAQFFGQHPSSSTTYQPLSWALDFKAASLSGDPY